MGWLDRINAKKEEEKLPQRLRDKSPEDIVKELEAADKLKTEHELLKAHASETDSEVEKIKTEFETVKERLAAVDAAKNRTVDNKQVEINADTLLEDPKKILDAHTAPLAAITAQNAATTARILAQQQLDNNDLTSNGKTMDGRLFRAFGSEIDAESRKYAAVQLMKPEAWIGIFYYLKGQHAEELRDPEIRKKKYNFLEPPTPGTPSPSETKKEGVEGLTDEEKRVATRMNITPEAYAKRKATMKFVNV